MTFGDRMSDLRSNAGLTIRELDDLSGVSHSYISQIENGKREIPHPDILRKLAKPLNVTYAYLMDIAGYLDGIDCSPSSLEIETLRKKNEYLVQVMKLLVNSM